MAWYDNLLKMGGVPAPGQPQEIVIPKENRLSKLIKEIDKYREEKAKKFKDDSDMYNTLRDAGYTPAQALESVKSKKFPELAGGLKPKEKESEAKIEKIKAETERIKKGYTGKKTFDDAVRMVKAGEMSWEDLKEEYPTKLDIIKKLKKQLTPIEKSGSFTTGTGGLVSRLKSKFKKNQAEINAKTQAVIDQIETEADLDELLERKEEAEEKGIDVDAILEYFGRAE